MLQIFQNIGHFILVLLLLGCSAFFSGSETAFFNLSRKQIQLFKDSKHKLQNLAALLLNKPNKLLGCLLFGNMTVNVLYFAVSSILVIKIEKQTGITAATATAFALFFALLLLGEVFPKSLAFANSRVFSNTAALPLYFVVRILSPILFLLRFLIVEPALRLVLGHQKHPKLVTSQEFKSLIEVSRRSGLISTDENKLLTEIIELGFLKVRHVMQPRVDMLACALSDSVENSRDIMVKNNLTKVPVYNKNIDDTKGLVHLRQILLYPQKTLDKLVQRVNFVPEQKTVESLLEFFRTTQTDTAIVVDEYGGVAGLVRLEYIAGELLGPVEMTDKIDPIEKIDPFKFRLSGNLAIHDWAEAFGINVAQTRLSTIGGLVTALLGKMPENGNIAYLRNLKFTVEKVHKNRIVTLILSFEPANAP
ncbi:hemolysin family protein [Planctomycetota bacterium]